MRNRTDYEELVRLRLNEFTQAGVTSGEVFTSFNDAYIHIASRALCIESTTTLSTISGCPFVLFPSTGCRVLEISLSTGKGLMEIQPANKGRIPLNGTAPQYWFQWGSNVVIEPVPDAVYALTILYAAYPIVSMKGRDVYNNGNGISFVDTYGVAWIDYDYPAELPYEFHPCIVDFASYLMSLKFKRWGKAGEFYNQYVENLSKRKREYIERKAEQRAIHSLGA